ncbi:MAG: DUF3488 and transglutaminase-like domain-containing protein [Desulfobacteraceae bacterium]|nr:DUF3488 and transglutaminase-like domain-containing protein [Desulfobacteraceae bacterium]
MSEQRKYVPALTLALIVAVIPHALQLPLWIVAWCSVMWGYLLASLRFGWPRPNRPVRVVLALIGIAGLLATYSTRLGPEAYIGLLAIMAALKPFESATHRDRMITVFIAYFIIISSLLQTETFAITLYMFFSVLVTTAALVRVNNPYGRYRADLKRAGMILGQAVPLMIILFLLFPRMQGSLFGMRQTGRAISGFSEQLSPGSVSSLVKSDEVAFRALFKGPIPPADQLYWRGVVFSRLKNGSWHRPKRVPKRGEPLQGQDPVDYTISIEPHHNRWIFALDVPARAPTKWSSLYRDFTVQSRRAISRKRRYEMRSYPGDISGRSAWGVDAALKLPAEGNPRTRKLAAHMGRDTGNVAQIVERGLKYLEKNGFVYTLSPPLLDNNPMDTFLFESRQGYCEHYASAFAYLMRAAGVPARIVGGYLGGERNPFADYLIIRQSDAHAWVEVWSAKAGWTRVDPTLAVAPARLDRGAQGALSPGELPEGGAGKYLAPFQSFVKQLQLGWDALSLQWEAWFHGYSREEQQALLEKLGIYWQSWKGMFTALVFGMILVAGITGLYGVVQFRRPHTRKAPVAKYYEKFCKKLARAGLARPADMGPKDYAAFAADRRPDLREEVKTITDLYIRMRYGGDTHLETRKQFIARVRRFKPKQKS